MVMKLETQIKNADAACEDFNAKHPIGTLVNYWKNTRSGEPDGNTTTRSAAGVISACACVMLDGVRGGIALSHIEVIQ